MAIDYWQLEWNVNAGSWRLGGPNCFACRSIVVLTLQDMMWLSETCMEVYGELAFAAPMLAAQLQWCLPAVCG